jgi:6-pyruvoyltetrahydropterin/6-carboxytetrahydropterin synthase
VFPEIIIAKEYHFSAGHQLYRDDWSKEKNVEVFGQCAYPHGHNYVLEVAVSGEVDPETGMILNYYTLNKIVGPMVGTLDHCEGTLNSIFDPELTTAENMVVKIAEWIQRDLSARYDDKIFLAQLMLQETPKTKAVWLR